MLGSIAPASGPKRARGQGVFAAPGVRVEREVIVEIARDGKVEVGEAALLF